MPIIKYNRMLTQIDILLEKYLQQQCCQHESERIKKQRLHKLHNLHNVKMKLTLSKLKNDCFHLLSVLSLNKRQWRIYPLSSCLVFQNEWWRQARISSSVIRPFLLYWFIILFLAKIYIHHIYTMISDSPIPNKC